MHLLFLSDNFPPEVNAPASRTFEHCREWVRTGHQVTVVTGAPNFPKGKVYEGYQNRLWQCENMEGIKVIRVWTYITANEGSLRRSLDYLSFMVTAFLAALFVRRVDLVIGTSPQFFTVCAAYCVGQLKRIPFVFELRDMWPESIKAVGAMGDSAAIRFFEKTEMFLYRQAAMIIPVTQSFKAKLMARGVAGEKIRVITNGVDLTRFQPRPKDERLVKHFGLAGKFVAGYIGTHGLAHALETVLSAAQRLQNSAEGHNFRFIMLGHGARKQALIDQASTMGLDNVIFLDSVPKEEVVRYWSLLDVAIIHLKGDPLFTTVIPSKLFECMGMGIPVLHGVAGESATIVETKKVGLTFAPENGDELAAKVLQLQQDHALYSQLQANCLAAAGDYDRTRLAGRLLAILETTAAAGRKQRRES